MTTMTSTATEQTLIVGPYVKVERSLYCGRCEAPALVRVFRPRTGENTQVGAVTALLNGDLISELRCDICVFLEDWHVVEHLCPCGDVAQIEAELSGSMYEAVRRYGAGLWKEPPGTYHTYRICAPCAEAIDYDAVYPLREGRPGPDRETAAGA